MIDPEDQNYQEECRRLHKEASENRQDSYTDPQTRAMVFTEYFHQQRGECCGSRCRHCPYKHVNVPRTATTK